MTATRPGGATAGAEPTSKRLAAQVAGGSVVAMGATAVGCAALGVLAGAPAIIGIVVAAPVYAAGHLAVRAFRRKRADAHPDPIAADDDAATLASLDELLTHDPRQVPPTVEARVQRVARHRAPDDPAPRPARAPGAPRPTRCCAPRRATSPKPSPPTCACRATSPTGAPCRAARRRSTVLCDQLDLLGSKMDDVFDAACRADADALIAHGRFLAEKFGSGALALDPQRR